IYMTGSLHMTASSQINPAGVAENLFIYNRGDSSSSDVRLDGVGNINAAIYAPNSTIKGTVSGGYYGSFVGLNLDFENGSMTQEKGLVGAVSIPPYYRLVQ